MVSSLLDSLHELLVEIEDIAIPPFAILDCILAITRPQSHDRHVVLPAVCNATNISKGSFDCNDFLQHRVVDAPVKANPITERQADIDREALKVAIRIDVSIFLDVLDLRK